MGVGFTVGILADWTDISTPAGGERGTPRYRYFEPDGIGHPDEPLVPWERRPSWSYIGFNRFREKLCQAAGIPDLDTLWRDELVGDAALEPLIWHSDCEGILLPEECALVGPRLRQLLSSAVFDDPVTDYDRQHGTKLADLMGFVAEHPSGRLALVFC